LNVTPKVGLVREPLGWYVDKLVRGEPFTSLLYGDGEWIGCLGLRTGEPLSHGEVMTAQLGEELGASLHDDSPDLIRATDPILIHYRSYEGQDYSSVEYYGVRINAYLKALGKPFTFYDGTVWETASQRGELSPFLRALKIKSVLMVANRRLRGIKAVRPESFVEIPDQNAYASIDSVESQVLTHGRPDVCIVCTGLGAIPLVMRLRKHWPSCTYLDLGSTFDLFARLPSRGWREHLYRDEAEYRRIVNANLEGV